MIEAKFGFPSQIENDPIMRLVTYEDNTVEFAEERRLFYVALTRTKNRVYMVTPRKRPSSFVLELIKEFGITAPAGLNKAVTERYTLKCPHLGFLAVKNRLYHLPNIPVLFHEEHIVILPFRTRDTTVLHFSVLSVRQ